MLRTTVILCLVAVAMGQQRRPEYREPVPIVRMDSNLDQDGSFQWAYESADGQVAEAQGQQKAIGDGVGVVMQGSYSYTAPNGQLIEVRWIADENGFQPIGAHLVR
ncbi:endocuticle structural glycoprotein SgAbd-8-like [Pollicipes pollicipes]|uniref:endocuticle structural glycoprotein SgAbd-8-like n=1 Tax=Pollicipes pollicipes TaxID=41117 RepID=UPI0018849A11|nr:endocuticle structural glycoprotein SgAbd-8-like [Pollicipes pollicipes]